MANINKVYVNPNFDSTRASKCPSIPKNAISLHVNPNFSQKISQNPSKIFVNPNFVKAKVSNNAGHNLRHEATVSNEAKQKPCTSYNYSPHYPAVPVSDFKMNQTVSQSRYSIVRHNTSSNKPVENRTCNKINTVKINKYKSITLNNFKKTLDTTKPLRDSQIQNSNVKPLNSNVKPLNSNLTEKHVTRYKISSVSPQKCTNTNKYKFIRRTSRSKLCSDLKYSNKSLFNNKLAINKSRSNRCTKINNIPCPLYKKYGKCLRKVNGTCEFLHDKKHVAICRKFVKGLCYDKTCLLSHDITSKKMPTCYFYLQGLCNKDDCPYSHVKLNEKTKLCPDFLKGYCEKGDSCLKRHVYVNSKGNKFNMIQSLYSSKLNKVKLNSSHKIKKGKELVNNTAQQISDKLIKAGTDCRYYKDVIKNEEPIETDQLIKPSRCKLGSLPSYIKL